MKKFLLSLLCCIAVSSAAMAEVVTYTMSDLLGTANVSLVESITCGNVTFTFDKAAGSSVPSFWANGLDLRLYAKNTFSAKTNDGSTVNAISFTISTQGKKRLTTIEPTVGSVAQGVMPVVWTGPASEVSFTVGDKAYYGTDGDAKAGQFDFTEITIYTGADMPSDEPGPEPEKPATVESIAATYQMAKGDKYTMGVDLTVVYAYNANIYVYDGVDFGMIFKYDLNLKAGDVIAKGWTGKIDVYSGLTELVPDDALTASGTAAVPEPVELDAEMASVALIPFNQNMYVKLLEVTFAETTPSTKVNFTGVMGEGDEAVSVNFRNNYLVESVSAGTYDVLAFVGVYNDDIQLYPIEYIGESQQIEIPEIDNFNVIPDMEDGQEFIMAADVTVVFSSGAYTYVNDGYQNALIYKKSLGLNAGDVIAKGWKASLSIFNGLYEIVPAGDLTVASTGANVPAPLEVNAEDVPVFVAAYNQAAYIKLMGVTLDAATPASGSFTGTMGENTVNFYQRFNLDTVEAGEYNVTGFVAVYKTDVQIYPTSFESVNGIADVAADTDATVRYYTIQGIEVANPQPGNIYIRVQGNKADKFIKK